jgi:dynein heavy chain
MWWDVRYWLKRTDPNQMIPANLTLPPKAPPKEVPYFGRVPVPPPNDFPEKFSNFCFHSLFIKDEVIRAMVLIREECNSVMAKYRIFETNMSGKICRVEEFKQHQAASISSLKHQTREQGWVGKLEKIIRQQFANVGKGWFNIHEHSKETYEFGKLKKFLLLVNFMMQDTVLTLCKNSVKEFKEFILSYVPEETLIETTAKIKNVFKAVPKTDADVSDDGDLDPCEDDLPEAIECKQAIAAKFSKNKNPDPLFELDLVLKPGALIPAYSTPPEEVVSKIRQIFEDGIKVLTEIPQLEPILLSKLFRSLAAKTIKAPVIPHEQPKLPDKNKKADRLDDNAWLYYDFMTIIENIERAIEPLAAYVHTFSAFKEQNELNPDKYVSGLDDGENPISPEELKADISRLLKKEEELKILIPEQVTVSMFLINCKDIRNSYAGKYQTIVQKEIQLIAQKAKDTNFKITNEFAEIIETITREPTTIEELTDTKKYINEIGIEIEK